jgi:flagellar secretion chaperone FliS
MAFAATHTYMDDPASACPNRATMTLYDGAIAAMHGAVEAIAADDIEARCRSVQEATEIVTTLYLNVDIKREGEMAEGLAKIYGHILGLLMRVNLFNDAKIALRSIDLLEPLRESWVELDTLVASCRWPTGPVKPASTERAEIS